MHFASIAKIQSSVITQDKQLCMFSCPIFWSINIQILDNWSIVEEAAQLDQETPLLVLRRINLFCRQQSKGPTQFSEV